MAVAITKVLRALFARFLFAIHGLIVIWRVSSIYEDIKFWIFGVCLILLFLEGALLILQRQGDETRWFCLSVFLYLCAVVPPIWFLQYELCRKSIADLLKNVTVGGDRTIIADEGETAKIEFIKGVQFEFFIPLNREIWVQLLQQTMLLVLILGRWILPKGDVSRDHLSQLLLVFLAMAADMVELFDTFKEKQVKYSLHLTTIVLGVWSVSLIQFPLVLTGKASRKSRLGTLRNYSRTFTNTSLSRSSSFFYNELANAAQGADQSFCKVILMDVNFWGVLTSTLLQDVPFLVIRLYLLIAHQTISYTMIFFTCKNILVVALQCYRLIVVCCETHKDVEHCKFVYSMSHTSSMMASEPGGGKSLIHAAANALTMIHDKDMKDLRQDILAVENKAVLAIGQDEDKVDNNNIMLAKIEDYDDLDDGGFGEYRRRR